MFGSAAITVAATADPSGRKCWSMPSLRPSMSGLATAGACSPRAGPPDRRSSVVSLISVLVSSVISSSYLRLELDLDVDARRKVEFHERVDGLLRRVVDVDEPLVGADLELVARVLVDERAADWSMSLWSYALSRIRIRCLAIYSMTFVQTPAPTVLPPSRIAKRRPSSRAIGVIRVTVRLVLSPGMTISTPGWRSAEPVTSVVRM